MFRTRRFSTTVAALLLGATLGACSREPLHPEAVYVEPKVNRVEWRVDRHPVQFAVGSDRPVAGELAALDRFLATYADAASAQIFIDIDPAVTGRELAAQRYAILHRHLTARGIVVRRMTHDPTVQTERPSDPRVATVYVGRFAVIPPQCPDWRKPSSSDFTNTQSSNFGCATALAFGQMLADPGDLVRSEPMGPADAARAALAIERYRKGETPGQDGGAAGSGGMNIMTTSGGN